MRKKQEEQKRARTLREEGNSLLTIARELNVCKASVSVWVRDIPQPEEFTSKYRKQKKLERLERIRQLREEQRKLKRAKTRFLNGDGYWMIVTPEGYKGKTYFNGRYVYEHRYLMEQKLDRLLKKGETVHHVDNNKQNNATDNLDLFSSHAEHISYHRSQTPKTALECAECGKTAMRIPSRIPSKLGSRNVFCSSRCAGKYNRRKQIENGFGNLRSGT